MTKAKGIQEEDMELEQKDGRIWAWPTFPTLPLSNLDGGWQGIFWFGGCRLLYLKRRVTMASLSSMTWQQL
uniref:Uncharacterized protein n=1 Tax=Oryza sativa subsp. japonica TaxID=39947 RepID=Q6Z465_ORYSJ|nr:hypothetical protein [Oryza sativa Japonica Group]